MSKKEQQLLVYLLEIADGHENVTCPCTVAKSTFNSSGVIGEVVFAQNTRGSTIVTGLFSDGLVDPEKNCYNFLIVDDCGKVLYNLTSALDVKYRKDGTLPFSTTRLDDLNLNCNSDGVLLAVTYKKRYHKRQGAGMPYLEIRNSGDVSAQAPIGEMEE
ncbi:hypothetical protein Glove_57g7 [Diversispora epigaea]|uniref:Uncharacterized protein n=1 Tax=Diversispora epigaea TaxID=1348612 RepID=A0A397JCD0_9GLOM|nr:hypothetical protein Glove_57g7 [Diversispora epigaea]